jgi:hypothetical protein
MMRSPAFLALVLSLNAQAQLAHGGAPLGWGVSSDHFPSVPTTTLSAVHPSADGTTLDTPIQGGYRFGEQRMAPVDILGYGQWEDRPEGGRVCRYGLVSPGAAMLSVQFDRFHVPEGGKVFVYNTQRTAFLGSFTHANEQPTGDFATALVAGDAIVIEYQEPPGAGRAMIHVASVTHAWRNIFVHQPDVQRDIDPGYQSSPCHNNVACPIAADWQDQNHSVLWFMMPSGQGCDGTLLNNTAEDGTPYVLIANHCYEPTESQWIFYFNYQSPTCIGDTGQTTQTLVGSVRRSATYQGDYNLMELNDMPPASFGAYYSGWDRSGTPPQSGASILNPQADVKKISFYDVPATSTVDPEQGTACWQSYWYSGILEAGASGAPLFDQNKRVVGHIIGGEQTCETATTEPTIASKFSENWNGPTPGTRLRDWLDPANTSTMALDGYDPNGNSPTVSVRLKVMLQGPYVAWTGMMSAALDDGALLPLTEPYTALGYVHVGGGGGETTIQDVLDVEGVNEVVDWVIVELRDKNAPSIVLASRSALLRRNGTVVDADGTSDVTFTDRPADQYYVAVRHRNHLGIMTATAQPLAPDAVLMDLSDGSVPLLGGNAATKGINGTRCMWSGDVNMDNVVRYTGAQNDRDPILFTVGGVNATATVSGYAAEDVNLDGVVKYTGLGNDRDTMLLNVGSLPTGQRQGTIP